jgi:hypothetical protein
MIRQDARALELDIIAIIPALNGRQDIGLVKCGNMAKSSNRLSEILEKRRLKSEKKDEKTSDKEDKKEGRRNYRLEKIKEVTAKAYAVATKRKWLVFFNRCSYCCISNHLQRRRSLCWWWSVRYSKRFF